MQQRRRWGATVEVDGVEEGPRAMSLGGSDRRNGLVVRIPGMFFLSTHKVERERLDRS